MDMLKFIEKTMFIPTAMNFLHQKLKYTVLSHVITSTCSKEMVVLLKQCWIEALLSMSFLLNPIQVPDFIKPPMTSSSLFFSEACDRNRLICDPRCIRQHETSELTEHFASGNFLVLLSKLISGILHVLHVLKNHLPGREFELNCLSSAA